MGEVQRIQIPPKLIDVFAPPRGSVRYRCAYGGRGSGKSYSFAMMALVWGYAEPLRILCTRELQTSIKESFHAELVGVINNHPWMREHYRITDKAIFGQNGTKFIFKGLRHNVQSIRSTAHVDLCIVEEAEDIPDHSWMALTPTVRKARSEIWAIWNPRDEGSPTDERFRQYADDATIAVQMNYNDNPWFSDVLEQERERDLRIRDHATYKHIWEGAYLVDSDAQILRGKVRQAYFEINPKWDGPYFGMDYGKSKAPTTCVECYVDPEENVLYVAREMYRVGLDIDRIAEAVLEIMPLAEKHVIYADSADPETTRYVAAHGLPLATSVTKHRVETGVRFLRSFSRIVAHTECPKFYKESGLYAYKTDRLTGDITSVIIDEHDHTIDAVRYALSPIINSGGQNIMEVLAYGGKRKR